MSEHCAEHSKIIAELSRASAKIEIHGERLNNLTDKVLTQTEKFERLIGCFEPTIENLRSMIKDQKQVAEELKLIGQEAILAKGQSSKALEGIKEHKEYHEKKTSNFRWGFGILFTIISCIVGVIKAFGVI